MRILHVVPTYLPATRYGGPIHSVHGLCRGLVENGHAVDVYTTSVDGDRDSDVPHEVPVDLDGVQVTYFRSRVGRRLYLAPRMREALVGAIARYDLVHLHAVYLYPTNMAARVAHAAEVPYVLSPRGMLVPELIARKSAWLKTGWLTLIESTTLAHAAAMHMTSDRELHDARRMSLPLPAPCIVPNGVSGPVAHAQLATSARVQELLACGPFVLYLGRMHWKKGLARTLEALAGTDMRLVLCGPDDEGLTPELQRVAQQHGVLAQVRFEGPVHGDDKWALLQAARCVVLASDNENFGNVVPEAMWMGTPVVVTDQTGASEIVLRARAGLVCERDARALRSALLTLWRDDALRAEMGERGAQYARAELSWSGVAQAMAGVYEDVVQRQRKAAL